MRSSEMVLRSTRNTARVERFSSGYWRIHREQVPASYEDKDLWYSMCMSRGRVATFPTPSLETTNVKSNPGRDKTGWGRPPPGPRIFTGRLRE